MIRPIQTEKAHFVRDAQSPIKRRGFIVPKGMRSDFRASQNGVESRAIGNAFHRYLSDLHSLNQKMKSLAFIKWRLPMSIAAMPVFFSLFVWSIRSLNSPGGGLFVVLSCFMFTFSLIATKNTVLNGGENARREISKILVRLRESGFLDFSSSAIAEGDRQKAFALARDYVALTKNYEFWERKRQANAKSLESAVGSDILQLQKELVEISRELTNVDREMLEYQKRVMSQFGIKAEVLSDSISLPDSESAGGSNLGSPGAIDSTGSRKNRPFPR